MVLLSLLVFSMGPVCFMVFLLQVTVTFRCTPSLFAQYVEITELVFLCVGSSACLWALKFHVLCCLSMKKFMIFVIDLDHWSNLANMSYFAGLASGQLNPKPNFSKAMDKMVIWHSKCATWNAKRWLQEQGQFTEGCSGLLSRSKHVCIAYECIRFLRGANRDDPNE